MINKPTPLNQLYVDLNNEEHINAKKDKDLEKEALDTALSILENIKLDPARSVQIQAMTKTDPFCKFPRIIDMLTKELENG